MQIALARYATFKFIALETEDAGETSFTSEQHHLALAALDRGCNVVDAPSVRALLMAVGRSE